MANGGVALELKDIVKVYGEGDFAVNALKGINLTFRKNEFVSILGPSGCGKTTLLNIIGGLDRYTSGDLVIEGKSTKKYTDKDWDAYRNNCIGFVFQSYNLIPHQTVLSNVELALELSGVPSAVRKERALAMLERVGLKGQEHKKPNQLSGGQMQRVAIARALVNDPEIILADEPTGALDSETSVQIMDLLAEIAKDKLVIMVTHNGELAEKYSTRVIRFLDGEMQSDSDPYVSEKTGEGKRMRKPKMGFKTAFALSLKNLFSKRARTILTSVAGSIGIIGVALVLALSNGFNAYMSRMQTDTLSTYPLTISESSVDLSAYAKETEDSVKEKYPELDNVLVHSAFKRLTGMLKTNNLKDKSENGFLHYLETNADKELYYAITKGYGFDMNDYFYADIKLNGYNAFTSVDAIVTQIEKSFEDKLNAAMGLNTSFVRQYIPTIEEMPDRDLVLDQYDVLYGELPEFDEASSDKLVLVVDEYNGVADITLMLLGYISGSFNPATNDFTFSDENGVKESLSIEEIVGKEFYLATNDVVFDKLDPSDPTSGGYSYAFANVEKTDTRLKKLTVSGILREKKNVDGILDAGLAYSPRLTEEVLGSAKDSEIVSGFTGSTVKVRSAFPTGIKDGIPQYDEENLTLRAIGGVDTPSDIKIYAKNFEAKEQIKGVIDDWNELKGEDSPDYIAYSDMMSMMFGMLNTMVNAVTYVLVAFTSISLIVSSVMIGIITYISVVERTKEIGVLRALGAAKGEISNVFNAETFLIGLFAGLLGVGVTYLLSIPINIILANLVPEVGRLAVLNPIAAGSLIAISVLLTLIAGLIPARIAAKKDPVIALRSE
ncbi:MAG TPA: hypothetical protein DEV87_05460 [Clostridiales bacterium]|nr:hypothetical protein [Clostridiales bacterium]